MSENISVLIGRVSLRDRAAFEELYSATSAKLFGICLRILKDRAEAEDALQEVYVKIWDKASSFAVSDYSPISWLVAIARNHSIDRIRARKPQSVDIDDQVDLASDTPSPEAAAIASSERKRIEGCLQELDDNRADAVRSAYIEGYSYQELADRNKVPVNTMRTWLRRSLQSLRMCLER